MLYVCISSISIQLLKERHDVTREMTVGQQYDPADRITENIILNASQFFTVLAIWVEKYIQNWLIKKAVSTTSCDLLKS